MGAAPAPASQATHTDANGNVLPTTATPVPDSFIVSFKEDSLPGYVAAELFQNKQAFKTIESSSTLDSLLSKHAVTNLKPIRRTDASTISATRVSRDDAEKLKKSRKAALRTRAAKSLARKGVVPSATARELPVDNTYVLKVKPGTDIKEAIRAFSAADEVLFAEPVTTVTSFMVPNDPYYNSTGTFKAGQPDMWGMKLLNLESTWDNYTGTGVVVAVVDTGSDYNHEDLAANMWHNPDEIPGNGIDDDGNGFVDDVYGYDFKNTDNNPFDDNGHGTHVAGTIAAVGNNSVGVVGVACQAKIMSVKALDWAGSGDSVSAYNAIRYAADNGADIINCSFGGPGYSYACKSAVDYALGLGCKVVVAAGNDSQDARYVWPANYEGVITVGAVAAGYSTWSSVDIAYYSNHGPKVDVYAPGGYSNYGSDILSCLAAGSYFQSIYPSSIVGGKYLRLTGTSMATPHVSGLAALLVQKFPGITQEQVRQALRTSSPACSGGFNDDQNARLASGQACLNLTGPFPNMNPFIDSPHFRYTGANNFVVKKGLVDVKGTVGGANFQSYNLEYRLRNGGSWALLQQGFSPVTSGLLGTIDTSSWNNAEYYLRLRSFDTSGRETECRTSVQVDSTKRNNWPQFFSPNWAGIPGNTRILGTEDEALTFADLDNDGVKEIIGVQDKYLYVYKADGTLYNANYPVYRSDINFWASAPTVADLDGDGDLEIIIEADVPGNKPPIFAFHHAGALVTGFPAGNPDPVYNANVLRINGGFSPTVTDLDGDGTKEIIFSTGTWNTNYPRVYLHVLTGTGTARPGFPVIVTTADYFPITAQTVSDFNGDGQKEILLAKNYAITNSAVLAMYNSSGAFVRQYAFPAASRTDVITQVPTIADWNNDGQKELFVIASSALGNWPQCQAHLLNYNGNELPGWPCSINSYGDMTLRHVLTDIDSDGELEAVFLGGPYGTRLYAINYNGTYVPGYPTADLEGYSTLQTGGCPLAAGFSSLASGPSLFFGEYNHDFQGLQPSGAKLSGWPKATLGSQGTAAIADLDLNGKPDFGLKTYEGQVYIFEDPGTVAQTRIAQWPTDKGNNQRTCEPNIPEIRITTSQSTYYAGLSAPLGLRWQHLPEDEAYQMVAELVNTASGNTVEASVPINSFGVEDIKQLSLPVDLDAPGGNQYRVQVRCVTRSTGQTVATAQTPANLVVFGASSPPAVSNVSFTQNSGGAGTRVVIGYDLGSYSPTCDVSLSVSNDAGVTHNISPASLSGDVGANIPRGSGKSIVWNIANDLPGVQINQGAVRITALDSGTAQTGLGDSGTGILETIPPTVTGIACTSPTGVDVTFSEAVNGTALSAPASYSVSGTGRGTLAATPNSVSGGPATYSLSWSSGRQVFGQPLTVIVNGTIQDAVGNPLTIDGTSNTGTNTAVPITLGAWSVE